MTSEVPPSELVNVMLVLSSGDILYEKFLKQNTLIVHTLNDLLHPKSDSSFE